MYRVVWQSLVCILSEERRLSELDSLLHVTTTNKDITRRRNESRLVYTWYKASKTTDGCML